MKLLTRNFLDQLLFFYGLIVSVALTFGAFFKLENSLGTYSLIFFLPVSLYFGFGAFFKLARLGQFFLNHDQPEHHRYFNRFSIRTFFDQTDVSFWLILVLLSLSFGLTLFRLSLTLLP